MMQVVLLVSVLLGICPPFFRIQIIIVLNLLYKYCKVLGDLSSPDTYDFRSKYFTLVELRT